MNIPETNSPRIVVIGGGFAGINFIKKLRTDGLQVVLFDKQNYHAFQPLLYQVSTAGLEPDSIAYPLRKIFKKKRNFYFRMAEVSSIDTRNSIIHTPIGELNYDYLVLATGTTTNFFNNKGVESFGMPMKTVPEALNIRSLMLQNLEEADVCDDPDEKLSLLNFVIAGAGPTGVELAGALTEFRKNVMVHDYPKLDESDMQVHLIEGADRVLSAMSEKSSSNAQKFLEGMGVKVYLNTFVESYDGSTVRVNSGKVFKTKNFLWAAGVYGAPVENIGDELPLTRSRRYEVDHFNRVKGFSNIFALGDIALMETEAFPNGHPQVAQPAIQQGRHLAKNMRRLHEDKEMIPFKYRDKGTMATIGRNKAVVDLNRLHFSGISAWFMWMFVHLWFLVGFRNRMVTFFNWTYNYINYDRAARLIIRPFSRPRQP